MFRVEGSEPAFMRANAMPRNRRTLNTDKLGCSALIPKVRNKDYTRGYYNPHFGEFV